MALVITSEAGDEDDTTDDGTTEDPARSIAIGNVARMLPGEKVEAFSHTRPSQQIAPFRQMLRGDIAASLRIPQRYLDRDVSRANYSSMRADMLDTERLLKPIREMFGHQTAGRLYKAALPYIALRLGIAIPRSDYRLIPDGQPYIDPIKDIGGAVAAIAAGLSTHEHEIGMRGGDYRTVWTQLAKERGEAQGLGLVLDLAGTNAPAPQSTIEKAPESEKEGADSKKKDDKDDKDEARSERVHQRQVEIARASAPSTVVNLAPTVQVPQQAPPVVNVAAAAVPSITVESPSITNVVRAAESAAPIVNVTVPAAAAPTVNVTVPQAAAPIVNVSAPSVTVENTVEVPQRTVKATTQLDGSVLLVPQDVR
jgi:hypothetical protein